MATPGGPAMGAVPDTMALLADIAQAQERLPAQPAVDDMDDDDDSSSILSDLEEDRDEEEEEPQDDEMEEDEEEEEEEDEQEALPSDEEPEMDEAVETEGQDGADEEEQDEEIETQADEDNDTEAETERLEITPRKAHPRRAVLFNRNGSTVMVGSPLKNETPRKLIPRLGELQAPTSEMTSPNESEDELSAVESNMSSPTRKRKRSIDSDLTPRRKTTRLESEMPEDESDTEAVRKVLDEDDDDELSEGDDIQTPVASEDEAVAEAKEEVTAEQSSLEDEVEEKEGLSEEESSKRAEMELNHKKKAMEQMAEIDAAFMQFRNDLFEYRMRLLDEQITILEEDEQSHPLYQEFQKIITQRRDKQKLRAQKLYDFEMHCLKVKSVSERAAAHSQYMQDVRDARDKALEETSKEWYAIQKSRRDVENEEGARIGYYAGSRSDIINAAQSYNDEVSVLWGMKKNVGFPSAPELLPFKPKEIEEDLKKLGLPRVAQTRHAPNPSTQPQLPQQQHFPPQQQHPQVQQQLMQNSISAEEQFLEQTPWANPRHPTHAWMQTRPPSPNNQIPTATPAHGMLPNNATPAVLGSASTIPLQSSQGPTPLQGTIEQFNVGPARMQVVMTDRFMETPSRVPTRHPTPSMMSRQQSPTNMNGEAQARMYHQAGLQSPPTTNLEPLQNGVAGPLFRSANANVNGTAGMHANEGERNAEMPRPPIQV